MPKQKEDGIQAIVYQLSEIRTLLHEIHHTILVAHERQTAILERLRMLTKAEEQELAHIEEILEIDTPFAHQESENP